MGIRVLVYDDNKSRRESLNMLLLSDPRFEWAGAFPDCSHVIKNIEQNKPDVVLMDIQMPNVDGIEGVKLIKKHFPSVKVIMQTVFEDDDKVFESLRNGASGYILKKASPEKILEAIIDVQEGGAPISPAIASKVLSFFNRLQPPPTGEDFSLTPREKEILSLLVDGLSYKMIADKCSISIFTVNAHVRKIYEKLQVHSATEAAAKASRCIFPYSGPIDMLKIFNITGQVVMDITDRIQPLNEKGILRISTEALS
jgi:DNA-binding NarL/FixJ family response regulator